MRALLIFGLVVGAGCMTDFNGDSCVWAPGNDGQCPSSGGSSGASAPKYHSFFSPRFIEVGGVKRLLLQSSGEDYEAREEIAMDTGVAQPPRETISVGPARQPALACGTVCVSAWKSSFDNMVHATVRTELGWSTVRTHGAAIQAPAVATLGDVVLIAWQTWEADGARVELRRLDVAGNVIGEWTLARGVSHGHLSLSAGPQGALITWQRVEESTIAPGGTWEDHAWLVAQLLTVTGEPNGAAFEHPLAGGEAEYYDAAPAAFVDGAYRVVHSDVADDGTWIVVDPVTREMTSASIGELVWPRDIQTITPVGGGAVLTLSGRDAGSVVRVVDDRIVNEVEVGQGYGAPGVAVQPEGVRVAYEWRGSVYVEDWTADFAPTTDEPTLVAERYELDGGCSSGRGSGAGVLVLFLAVFFVGRRSYGGGCGRMAR